ncbi:hypothetical protein Dda_8383 [Drechslerella dactyloides]|uniref:Tip elongation aberrant protein 1 n=1 Tax=Drechslerella dactyloides TaxID=74499 RepID=A0AAD6IQK7_DREDA|nr:hypothetical protein Dda_8383 [Drechslerella dactyloides]
MREKDKHKDGVSRSKSKRKPLEALEAVRKGNHGDLIERSITPSDLYGNGGVLAGTAGGAATAGSSGNSRNSRPSSPVTSSSSILKKRTSFPVAGSFANILNFSPHRRRPSLQTRSSHHSGKSNSGATSAGPVSTSTYPHAPAAPSYSHSTISSNRSRSGSAHSPSVASLQNTPLQTPTTSTYLGSLKTLASESTTTLSSTASSSLSSMNPLYEASRAVSVGPNVGASGGDSPTVSGDRGLESPLSTRSEGLPPKSSRLIDAFGTSRYEENWDSDPAAEAEEDGHDDRAGSTMIPASRRIMTPQTPIREESNGNGSNGAAVGSTSEPGRYNTFRRGRGITEPDFKIKSRSNSTTSSRAGGVGPTVPTLDTSGASNGESKSVPSMGSVTPVMGPAKVVCSKKIVESSLDLLHTNPSTTEATATRTEGENISRPGSASPHPEPPPKTPSSLRSARDDATSSMSSTSASLRAASLNQVVAIKRQRELAGEEVPPKSSSSNSSSEALSTGSHGKGSKANRSHPNKMTLTSSRDASISGRRHPPSLELPLPDPLAPRVEPAPASGMYWYKAFSHGLPSVAVRAHTCTLIGSSIYVFGGCNSKTCFNDLYVFDADSMYWSKPEVSGDIPPPLRAMTTTAVNKKLVIFGGGDGPTYYNDVYVLDTVTHRYTKPKISGPIPSKRRAHTACLYKNGLYVFGGGDGVRALNDVWRLDVSDLTKMSWKQISSASGNTTIGGQARSGKHANVSQTSLLSGSTATNNSGSNKSSNTIVQLKPTARGYHTANMVQNKLIIFGGSDGVDCFKDVWVFDVDTSVWKCVDIKVSYPRLSHTATLIGSYLFVVGGHDGLEYSNEVLLLNLVTMQWDKRKVYGLPPSGRGYHGAALHDSRLFIIGGFDGHSVFNETFILELAISSYYSQISHFNIEV